MANIVICADGTWNRPEDDLGKDHATNVLKLARAVEPSNQGTSQQVFYDWGIGSYHSSVSGGVSGRGIHKNITDGYRYIVQNYEPGDNIYLLGFSRGAYTVRALCGLINNCGILKRADAKLISSAWKIYKSSSRKYHPDGQVSVDFRDAHSHPDRTVQFVGVWDTVGALGLPFSFLGLMDPSDEFYDTKMGPNIKVARHALAIDEQREDFEPTLWRPKAGVDLKQVWFAGVHSDVGGSYGPDKKTGNEVSDVSLEWMLEEARQAGLHLEGHLKANLTNGIDAALNKSRRHLFRFKRPLHRDLQVDGIPTLIHPSVKRRYESDTKYRPPKLKQWVERDGWQHLPVGD